MNYIVKATRIYSVNDNTQLEDYSRECLNYAEAVKEENRLKSLGEYSNIRISKIEKISVSHG